jgi:hypothetical protein
VCCGWDAHASLTRRMCGSALDEGGGAASQKLMGRHKTPPLFSRQGLEDQSSLAIFFTEEVGFFTYHDFLIITTSGHIISRD